MTELNTPLNTQISRIIASELTVQPKQILSAIGLLDEGNTVPFIARYRKEVTGGLDDTQLRHFETRLIYLRELNDRRQTILKSIDEQGKLSDDLKDKIYNCQTKTELEDLYLPYKPKRRTKGQIAIEAGLDELAHKLWIDPNLEPSVEAMKFINVEKGFDSEKKVLDGARYILMEEFADNAELLAILRDYLQKNAIVCAKVIEGKEEIGNKFKDYFDYSEKLKTIASHRALAVFRGRDEGVLSISLKPDDVDNKISEPELKIAQFFNITATGKPADVWRNQVIAFTWKVKIATHLETQLMSELKDRCDVEATDVFGANLSALLMAAPAGSFVTMGLDPGIRTGVKVAVVDETGKLLDTTAIYPHTGKAVESMQVLATLIKKHNVKLIAIGNGTASRETEKFAKDLLDKAGLNAQAVMVSEAGASVYSASELAAKEFPELDVSLRGAVSIARRLQDPLAELVKIDPKAIGVGQYQHDVNQTNLAKKLENVVEDCVNKVGVDLNTASVSLLNRVSGLNTTLAQNIVDYRDQNGKFEKRNDLKKVPRLGPKAFEQCAGFLKIANGANPLDNSSVHPESYPIVEKILETLGVSITDLIGNCDTIRNIRAIDFVNEQFGLPTINDILKELEKPGRDPRGDFKTATFKDGINEISDLVEGMELEGVVTNVTNFGAFVDIGVHQDGLVHISHLANKFVDDPNKVVKTGDIVKVWVLEVDENRRRIALSMKGNNKTQTKMQAVKNNQHFVKNNTKLTANSAMADAFAKLKR